MKGPTVCTIQTENTGKIIGIFAIAVGKMKLSVSLNER
jgi:hypothetical protein